MLDKNIKDLILFMQNIFKPVEKITVTECAEKYRVLPASNREGGAYRVSRTPFARDIMDAFNDSEVEEITVMGSAQWAKTTIMENIIAYIIKVQPSNILIVLPTLDFARRFSKTRLEPMIEDSPEIKKLVAKKKSRDSDNTILSKSFVGGNVVMVGANSPGGLRGYTAPYIFADDIDAIDIGMTKEGDFIARAERAAETYEGMRKYYRASTPSIDGLSRIYNYYKAGTQEEYHVPCIRCGEYQLLELSQLKWEYEKDMFGNRAPNSDKYETATLQCKYCAYSITEADRQEMILKGKWVAKFPERKKHRSFFFNRFTSPFSSLANICKEYVLAQIEDERMQTFYNLYLGLPYKPASVVELSEIDLMTKLENYLDPAKPYVIPDRVLMLVASGDVQADRIEIQVWGYGVNYEAWILNRFKFYGDPKIPKESPNSPWKSVENVLTNVWTRTDGVNLKIAVAGIDSQFLSDEVYAFVRGHEFTRNWWAIKGSKNPFQEIVPTNYRTIENKRAKYLKLGVNLEKQSLFERLKMTKPANNEPAPKYIHFDEALCDAEYFEELTAEHGIKKTSGNVEYVLYVKKKSGVRNEALDLLVYNSILAKTQNPNWEKIIERLDKQKQLSLQLEANDKDKNINSVVDVYPTTKIKLKKNKITINKVTNW